MEKALLVTYDLRLAHSEKHKRENKYGQTLFIPQKAYSDKLAEAMEESLTVVFVTNTKYWSVWKQME